MVRKILEDLIKNGLTEAEIVSLLKREGIVTTQPTINRIKTGIITSPKYDIGVAIVALRGYKKNGTAKKQGTEKSAA